VKNLQLAILVVCIVCIGVILWHLVGIGACPPELAPALSFSGAPNRGVYTGPDGLKRDSQTGQPVDGTWVEGPFMEGQNPHERGTLTIRGGGVPTGAAADFQPQQEAQGPPMITDWNTDNLVTLQHPWPRCRIVLSPTGKVTLTDCKDADEAALTFWKAVEQNWPCRSQQEAGK
jgi:hypothetical protein